MTLTCRQAVENRIRRVPIAGSPIERRDAFERLVDTQDKGIASVLGDVPVYMHGTGRGADIVLLHGGGYMFGSPTSHANAAAFLARLTDRRVIVPAYRLAPENKWPAPLDDICSLMAALDGPIDLVGDSAGGHLAIVATLRRPQSVRRLALISPNTDRTGRSTTRRANTPKDLMNDDETDRCLANIVFEGIPDDHPHVSPLLSDLTALPPTFVTASTTEVLLDDALLFARELALQNVPVKMEVQADLFHMWTLWPEALDEAVRTWSAIACHFALTEDNR